MLQIIERMESREIPILPYKGPVLAQLLYGDVGVRQFGDIDLFVRPQDVRHARTVLLEMGYALGMCLTARQEQAYIKSASELVFHGVHGRNLVEIQWRIVPRFFAVEFNLDDFFSRAIPVSISGTNLRTLCLEDLFLVLCVHAAKHTWNQLSYLCDLARLITMPEVNWDLIEKNAADLKIRRIVAVTLALLKRTNLVRLPEKVDTWLRSQPVLSKIVEKIIRGMASGITESTETLAYFLLMLRVRERWQDRAAFLSWLLIDSSSGEWNTVQLPDRFFSLYRAVRP